MQNQNGSQKSENSDEQDPIVTRESLYTLVWAEPMLKVAARFGVSSSYMARVCGAMNVPRPERGYWARLAVGKQAPKPKLPDAGPGDELQWSPGSVPHSIRRPLPRPPAEKLKRKPKTEAPGDGLHALISGARVLFDVGRTSYDSSYLKPAKRTLVDLVVTKTGLDKALAFANQLFLELEAHGCQVVFAPNREYMRRAQVDEHEIPRKKRNDDVYGSRLWHPGRVTVVYIGTVAIGLTIIELSEEAEVRYVKGEYVRINQDPEPARRRRIFEDSWTTKRDFPTGRLFLQAYSPDRRGEWSKQWRETKERDLTSRIASIVKELTEATPVIAGLIEEGARKDELQRKQWEEQSREWERQQAEERAAKARNDSRNELLHIVHAWARAKRIEEFFRDAEARIVGLDAGGQALMQGRLTRARRLIGGVDALERFRRWTAPEERHTAESDDYGDGAG